jgi:uncharacterized protein
MRIGIISDTHNNLENFQRAIEYLNSKKVALVIHCGDWTNPSILEILKNLEALLKGVLGNCDTDLAVYSYKLERDFKKLNLKVKLFTPYLELEFSNKKIAAVHGDDEKLLSDLIHSEKYDLVCCGHTHRPKIDKVKHTLVINPGAVAGFYNINPPVKAAPTLSIYDVTRGVAEIVKI